MGPRCNSSYKLAQDVLRDHVGSRRVCFDPYAVSVVSVSLMESTLFARDNGLPEWHIDLVGDAARVATWDDIFPVKERFIIDHLDSIYKNCIKVFGTLCRKRPEIFGAAAGICDAFARLAELSRAKGWSDRAFLEAALFELLHARCAAGGIEAERVVAAFTNALFAST
jgi:hypothetical protein